MEIMKKTVTFPPAQVTKTPDFKGDLREVAEQFEAIFINQFLYIIIIFESLYFY